MNANVDKFPKIELDAKTFQYKLEELTNTIAYKVQREGEARGLKPGFVSMDIYFQIRMAHQIYNLFFYLNSDQRRREDCDWKVAYSAAILPLVRTMIDCLFNVTAILQDPPYFGRWFRQSGYRYFFEALDQDHARYAGQPRWDAYIAKYRQMADFEMRRDGLDETGVRAAEKWQTLSRYVDDSKHNFPAKHQDFLKKLTLGFWKEYSGISHATFNGLLPIALFLAPKDLPHEHRPSVDLASDGMISLHIARVSAILLSTLTEVQACCSFDGARINQRLHEIWNVLIVITEVKELYDERYAELMRQKGIHADY
jgi:hypothetical protein